MSNLETYTVTRCEKIQFYVANILRITPTPNLGTTPNMDYSNF